MADKASGVDTHVPSKNEKIDKDKNYEPGTTGAVLSENDGRLKENRNKGVTLGTTAHSASAPNVKDK